MESNKKLLTSNTQMYIACLTLFLFFWIMPVAVGETLKIETEAFAQPHFVLGDGEPKPVYKDSDLNPEFISVLESNPEALTAAQNSLTHSVYSMGGSLLILAGAIVMLKDTLNDKNDLENNQLPTEEDDNTDAALTLVIFGGIAMLVGSINRKSDLNRAFELYNQGGDSPQTRTKPSREFNFGIVNKTYRLSGRTLQSEAVMLTRYNYRF